MDSNWDWISKADPLTLWRVRLDDEREEARIFAITEHGRTIYRYASITEAIEKMDQLTQEKMK